ncbi:restriction endonuclease subunit S [Roseomonas sp. CECT 9278]|uniref:restriction endonuclease subunit S n=1 Tax=Roseomonas sp. CECT 9278 TaxID=2845823 RepID=UPI001E2A28A6|nr:restriction endonuclease subunit S [Roseomonas sp. CECT 9278]
MTPKRRFPKFEGAAGWKIEKVDKLVETVTPPKKLPTSHYAPSGQFPIIDQSKLDICGWTSDHAALIQDGLPLIVFGDHTCILKLIDRPFAQGADGIKILSCRPKVETYFLYQYLNYRPVVTEEYKRHYSILKEKLVPFPNAKTGEQQKIADCLASADALIEAQRRKVEALKAHRKGLMQQLFPKEGETEPRLRFPEFESSGEWEEGTISDIGTVLQGYGFPERLQGLKTGDYPFYKVSDISRSLSVGRTFIESSANYVNENHLKELRAKLIPAGTTVFAKIGEAIRSDKRAITTTPCLIDNNAAGVKSIKVRATDFFIYLTMEQISLIDHAGGVVPAVNKSAIEAIPVKFPKVAEQQRIADCLGSLDDLITSESQKLDTLKTHKKGLMQQLFPLVEDDDA